MYGAVRHECHSGAQFTINFYRHWDSLAVRDLEYGSGHLLHSKEGVTQGGLSAMIEYVIEILHIIR